MLFLHCLGHMHFRFQGVLTVVQEIKKTKKGSPQKEEYVLCSEYQKQKGNPFINNIILWCIVWLHQPSYIKHTYITIEIIKTF